MSTTLITSTVGAVGTILSALVVALVTRTLRVVNGRTTALLDELAQLRLIIQRLEGQLMEARQR